MGRNLLTLVAALIAVATGVYLYGGGSSEADKKIDDLVASTKTCGDYAALAAESNCIRFVEENRKSDLAFAKNAGRLVKALEAHWDKTCAERFPDIETLQLKTTIALTRNGPDDKAKSSTAICHAQVEESLKAYPALANDRSNFTR
jgi:hypothetical protein